MEFLLNVWGLLLLASGAQVPDASLSAYVRNQMETDLIKPEQRERIIADLAARGEPAAWALAPYLGHDAVYVAMVAREVYEKLGPLAAPVLRHLEQESESTEQRRLALFLLSGMGDPEDVPRFARRAQDADWRFRALAARGIGSATRANTRHTAHLLIPLLRDTDVSVRRWAVAGLGQIGNPEMVPFLANSLADPAFKVREKAVVALGALARREGASAVRAAAWPMVHRSWPEPTRAAAIRVLAVAGEARDADRLAPLAKDPAPVVRAAAVEAVFALAPARAKRLLPARDPHPYVTRVYELCVRAQTAAR